MVTIQTQYNKSLTNIRNEIMKLLTPQVKDFLDQRQAIGAFLQKEDISRNVENVAISILPVPSIDQSVQNAIKEINSKRMPEEEKQIKAGADEFPKVEREILNFVKAAYQKYIGGKKIRKTSSFMEDSSSTQSGINPVLNVRIGSSGIGDGLLDGSSYPSIVSLVSDENEKQDQGESTLLNSILFYTRKLGLSAVGAIVELLHPPGGPVASFFQPSPAGQLLRKTLAYLPPAVPRVIRKHAMKYSTVQFDISPPEADSESTKEQLNAMLEGEMAVQKSRRASYIHAKSAILKEIKREIDVAFRKAAIDWGIA